MQTDRQIVARYSKLFCDLFRRFAIKIDAFDELCIVASEVRKKRVKAFARGRPCLVQWRLLKGARNG